MAVKKIVPQTAPVVLESAIQSPMFRDDWFDELIFSKGVEVIHESAIACPCRVSGGSALATCQNCNGYGWLFINSKKTRMVMQSMNLATKYKEWSKENLGTVTLTSRSIDPISFMDRITVNESESIYQQVLYPSIISNDLFCFSIYDIVSIIEIFAFVSDVVKLKKLIANVDYTFVKNKITFDPSYKTVENFTVSVRYIHKIQYHIIDLVKETRNQITKTEFYADKNTKMPFSAIARRSHYVLDSADFNGLQSLDNSYGEYENI